MNAEEYKQLLIKVSEEGGFPSAELVPDTANNREKVCCKYRGPNGRKCVAGHAMPNGKYYSEMEGKSVCDSMVWYALEHPIDQNGMSDIQRVHDTLAERVLINGEDWPHEEFKMAISKVFDRYIQKM